MEPIDPITFDPNFRPGTSKCENVKFWGCQILPWVIYYTFTI